MGGGWPHGQLGLQLTRAQQEQVAAVRARLLPDDVVQAIAPKLPLQALRLHLHRRHYDVERVRLEAQRAHVSVDTHAAWGRITTENVRVFWPCGSVDRLRIDHIHDHDDTHTNCRCVPPYATP